jgi:hypothetical protein
VELNQELHTLERKRKNRVRNAVKIKSKIEGETMSKSWFSLSKEIKPRDVMYALKKNLNTNREEREETEYEKHSQKMAEIARDYHDNLQTSDLEENEEDRGRAIESMIRDPDKSLNNEERKEMEKQFTYEEIEAAQQARQD